MSSVVLENGKLHYSVCKPWYQKTIAYVIGFLFVLGFCSPALSNPSELKRPFYWLCVLLVVLFTFLLVRVKDEYWSIWKEEGLLIIEKNGRKSTFTSPVEIVHDPTQDGYTLYIQTEKECIMWIGAPTLDFLNALTSFAKEAGLPFRKARREEARSRERL